MAKMAKEAKSKGIAKTKSDSTKSPSKAKGIWIKTTTWIESCMIISDWFSRSQIENT